MSKSTFTISRASLKDIPKLVKISSSTFEADSHSQMKSMGQKPGSFDAGMAEGIKSWIESPRAVVFKATDDRDGTIVGSVCWGFRGVELDTTPGPDDGTAEQVQAVAEKDAKAGDYSTRGATKEENLIPGAEKIQELETMTSDHLSDFMERIMPEGTKCIFVVSISVDPRFQGEGAGSQLIQWGTEQADRLNAIMWVHSSEAGWPMFAKNGFEEAERLTFDMDKWAVGPPPKDSLWGKKGKWGEYTFRYMVRQPVQV
ncbi:acyl-CoA N-acyltransferase [Xylariales sp. AK1849]|nr:acyl-CoA N-acyltransferase [Xylariales sp. AK1849]